MIFVDGRWMLKCQVSNYKRVNKKRREKSLPRTEDYKGWKASCQTNNLYLWERWASRAGILCARKQKIIWLGLTTGVESRCISGELNSGKQKRHSSLDDGNSFYHVQFTYVQQEQNCCNNGEKWLMRLCDRTASRDLIGNLAFIHYIV